MRSLEVVAVHGVTGRLHLALLRRGLSLANALGRGTRWGPVYLGRLFPASNSVTVRLSERSRLSFPLWDGYWARLLGGHKYEPDTEALLTATLPHADLFIDGGANIGYWSVIASETTRTVAVEPSPPTLFWLHANAALNDTRFQVVEAALWHSDDVLELRYRKVNNAGASLASAGDRDEAFEVRTITLDELLTGQRAVVVKLDVEGVETEALRGGRALDEMDALVIYEDHGKDSSCQTSKALLEQGRDIYGIFDGRLYRYSGVEAIRAMKVDPQVGYNFFTHRVDSRFADVITSAFAPAGSL